MFVENALKHTKDVIVYYLRSYFANYKNYSRKIPQQISEDLFTKAIFYDTEPEQLRSFPVAILVGGSGRMVTSGLSDFAQEIVDPRSGELIAYRYNGIYEFSFVIELGCRSTLEREVFTDLVAKALRHSLRRYMEAEGVLVTTLDYGGESIVNYDSNHIYVSQLKVTTWSTWFEDEELLPNDGFNVRVKYEE